MPGGYITFGNSVDSNGKIEYFVSMNIISNPSLSNKQSIGKIYRSYKNTPSNGTTTYISGGLFSLSYQYYYGTIVKGGNTGWNRLGYYDTQEEAEEAAENARKSYSDYDTKLIEIVAEYNNDMKKYQVVLTSFDLTYSSTEATGEITGTMPVSQLNGFKIVPEYMNLEMGQTGFIDYLIEASPMGSNPEYILITESSDTDVAIYNEPNVEAKAAGRTVITFTATDKNSKQSYSQNCSISVYFKWETEDIFSGNQINNYNNKPAPVKASEWNKLVNLVNMEYSKNISSVSQGEEMVASPGGNVRSVADALNVRVESGEVVTAQFFLNLETAINNKLKQ